VGKTKAAIALFGRGQDAGLSCRYASTFSGGAVGTLTALIVAKTLSKIAAKGTLKVAATALTKLAGGKLVSVGIGATVVGVLVP